jgi:hypothetical protein
MLQPPDFVEQLIAENPDLDSNKSAEVFRSIAQDLCDAQYWETLRWMWIRHGRSISRLEAQTEFLMADRGDKQCLMTENERAAFEKLPEEMTIFHGTTLGATTFGWSWSLQFNVSYGFARNRFSTGFKVMEGRCKKTDVIAYFPDYDESEIVIDPARVTILKDLAGDALYDAVERHRTR